MSNSARKLSAKASSLPTPSPVPNRRVLVVDDEIQIAESLQQILAPKSPISIERRSSRSVEKVVEHKSSSASFDVVVVNNPDDAILAIEDSVRTNRPFALGFFDVLLHANMDGIELVKKIQAIDPRIYSVFVTAYHDRTVDAISQFLGEDNLDRWDYINKPFTEGEILQKARHLTSMWDLHQLKDWQEERLAEAQKLLLQNERQNTVAAIGRSFAHEFGNLLTHIMGNADMALIKNEPERMREALRVILKASETASTVLGRFKKFDAPTIHGMKKHQLINLQFPIEEALELMAFQFRKSQIEWVKERFDAVLIEADKHSLVQVLMNLFINASHSMTSGGKIFVQLQKIDAENARITIRDTGNGIPESILHKVTDPLFTTKGTQGTGLGLSISKEIIEIEHLGNFQIANHIQGGVEVQITLPVRQEADDE